MATLKNRIEWLEEKQWQERCERLNHYLEGRSFEDVEFFCAHGYLPEVPIPGAPFTPLRLLSWKEYKRTIANRSEAEMEHFCKTGRWPEQSSRD